MRKKQLMNHTEQFGHKIPIEQRLKISALKENRLHSSVTEIKSDCDRSQSLPNANPSKVLAKFKRCRVQVIG